MGKKVGSTPRMRAYILIFFSKLSKKLLAVNFVCGHVAAESDKNNKEGRGVGNL